MNTLQDVRDFIAQKTLAVVGLSRDPQAFSATAAAELEQRGYKLLPVNPNAERIGDRRCYPSVATLPGKVGGVLVFTPPAQTMKVVQEAVAAGIRRVWIQQGAQSDEAVAWCSSQGIPAVTKRCILMFAEPVRSLHAAHRWFAKLFATMPR